MKQGGQVALIWAFILTTIVVYPSFSVAGVSAIAPGDFSSSAQTITFSEAPVRTEIPFQIGSASFVGLHAGIYSFPSFSSPSGGPFLWSETFNNDDIVEVHFSQRIVSVGSYFCVVVPGVVQLEIYDGSSLLGIVPAVPDPDTLVGFVGASDGGTSFDRVIFRDIDPLNPISFQLDDFVFAVPEPDYVLLVAGLPLLSRRRR